MLAVLGALSASGPLSMDMYLPSTPTIAASLHAGPSLVQLTLSGCLAGLAVGQLVAAHETRTIPIPARPREAAARPHQEVRDDPGRAGLPDREGRVVLFASPDRSCSRSATAPPPRRRSMFANSDRTRLQRERRVLNWSNALPLVGAHGAQPTAAVTSRCPSPANMGCRCGAEQGCLKLSGEASGDGCHRR
jgi:hypothetical protein